MENRYRASALRASRAWTGLEQKAVATAAGVGERTLLDAEAGRACSNKTWEKVAAFYATRGLHWRDGDAGELGRMLVLTLIG